MGGAGSSDGSGGAARFNYPGYVAFDSLGNALVTDRANHAIRKITPAGLVSTFAGSPTVAAFANGAEAAAMFGSPEGIALDRADNVYEADSSKAVIRKITPAGLVSSLAGSRSGYADGAGAAAQFRTVEHVAVDSAGNVYVSDAGSYRIRKITPAGLVSTLAGYAAISGAGSAARA